jgi:hypothetical protein
VLLELFLYQQLLILLQSNETLLLSLERLRLLEQSNNDVPVATITPASATKEVLLFEFSLSNPSASADYTFTFTNGTAVLDYTTTSQTVTYLRVLLREL